MPWTSIAPAGHLDDALLDVVRLSRQAADADHASLLLVDDTGRLVPAASAVRDEDELLWHRFRSTGSVRLDAPVAGQRAFAVEDAATSPLVPDEWREAFDLRSAAVAPLDVDGDVRGVLVVNRSGEPRAFTPAEVAGVDAVATALRYALRAAADGDRAAADRRLLDLVLSVTTGLQAARTRHAALQLGMEGVLAVLDGAACSVNVVAGEDSVETLASRGLGQPEPGRHPAGKWLDAVTRETVRRLLSATTDGVVTLPGRRLVALPVVEHERVRAIVLAGFDVTVPDDQARLAAARALAEQTWLAWERIREEERQRLRVEYHETLCRLGDEAALVPDMQLVLRRLAPTVRAATGAELIDAVLCDAAAARVFSASTPHGPVAALVRGWRRGRDVRPTAAGELLVVPMLLEGQVVGAVRVRQVDDVDDDELLLSVATGIAEVVASTLLRVRVATTERELAVAEERERLGRDLHDTLGQQLFALGNELRGCATDATDPPLRSRLDAAVTAVARASTELRQAIHALSFLENAQRGLAASLRALARDMAKSSEVSIEVRVTGSPARLRRGQEEALFRVAHEALSNVVRHARASVATVTVAYETGRASLVVQDNGTGMSARADDHPGMHFGLRTMQRRMDEAGGGLEVTSLKPHGLRLHAWVVTA